MRKLIFIGLMSFSFFLTACINEKVLICGICRDVAFPLFHTIKIVESMGNLFKDYRVIAYENNSKDETLQILQKWAEGNPKVLLKSEWLEYADLEKVISNIKGGDRHFFHVEEIALARNKVMDIAMSKEYEEYSYIIWLDMDFKAAPDLTGLKEIFKTDREWDAIFAYGQNRIDYKYWDWYAFRDAELPIGSELLGNAWWYLPRTFKLSRDSDWYPVYSAFGGCGIYKKSSIRGCRYSGLVTKDLETVSKKIIEEGKKSKHPQILQYLEDLKHLNGIVKIEKPCPNLQKITDPNIGIILNDDPNPLIWKMSSFVYQYPSACDTVPFHASMIAHGHDKLFINPRFVFTYGFDEYVKDENEKELELLLLSKANLNRRDSNGYTLLMTAACINGSIFIKAVLDSLTEEQRFEMLHATDNQGLSALHFAIKNNNFDAFIELINQGTKWDLLFKDEELLVYAIKHNPGRSLPFINFFINYVNPEKKVDILNKKDSDGLSALHLAIKNNDTKVFDTIIDNGADLYVVDSNGNNLIMWATMCEGWAFIKNLSRRLPKEELKKMLNLQNKDGLTPLYLAVMQKNLACIQLLIGLGADVKTDAKTLDSNGNNLIMHGIMHGYKDFIKAMANLLTKEELKTMLNARNNDGLTPLHLVVRYEVLPLFRLLIELGADVKTLDANGNNLIMYGIMYEYQDFIKAVSNTLTKEELKTMLNARNNDGLTPLHLVVKHNAVAAAQLLIELGADVKTLDADGNNLIMYGIMHGYKDFIKAMANLLTKEELKTMLNARNKDGLTPLHLVERRSGVDAELLIELGANKNM